MDDEEPRTDLPRFIAILMSGGDGKYLNRVYDKHETREFLQFSGENIWSPYAKFEVVPASVGDGLVHIRSCFNNKYWVYGFDNSWIVAGADEMEENQNERSCTLFRPQLMPFSSVFGLCHVYSDFMVRCWSRTSQQPPIPNPLIGHTSDIESPYNDCLYAGVEIPENRYYADLVYTDWVSILPTHIAIKGGNGLYLGASETVDEGVYLKFSYENNQEERVRNRVCTGDRDNNIRIFNSFTEKFWKRRPNNWICPDLTGNIRDETGTLFEATRIDDNTITLCNIGNNHLGYSICKRHTANGKNDCLHAFALNDDHSEEANNNPEEAHFQVEELVVSREIYQVNFHRLDYRWYDKKTVTIGTATRTNRTPNPMRVTFTFTYRKENSQTWNATVSWKKNVNTKIRAGIPYVDDEGRFRVSTEVTTDHYQWGETIMSESDDLNKTHEVEVPPMTRITVSLLATEEAYDIPYSYTQCDTLINDEEIISYDERDGLYTGVNTYNFRCITTNTESL